MFKSIILTIFLWIIISTAINAYLMTLPIPLFRKRDYPKEFLIHLNNQIDYQENVECAAFSTAYVLRYFGVNANGKTLYEYFPCKTKTGTVYPKGIRKVLKQNGFKTKYYKGNIHTLKYEVSKGIPIIVFIKVELGQNNLHFVPVVGYDEEYIYLADSLERLSNCKNRQMYNRKVSINEFKKLWNIKTIYTLFYSNTYISIKSIKK